MAPALKPSDFYDADTFGLDWNGKYVQLGLATGPRVDNKGNRVALPVGAIGYVAQATPGSVLVVFAPDPRSVPEPTDHVFTVTSRRYGAVLTFGFADWKMLRLKRSR